MKRIRITHPHDLYKGKIGYIVERVDQHSLCTYIVTFKGSTDRRAYQRNDFKFLKHYNKKLKFWI